MAPSAGIVSLQGMRMVLDVLLGVCFFAAVVCVLSLPWMLGDGAAK